MVPENLKSQYVCFLFKKAKKKSDLLFLKEKYNKNLCHEKCFLLVFFGFRYIINCGRNSES